MQRLQLIIDRYFLKLALPWNYGQHLPESLLITSGYSEDIVWLRRWSKESFCWRKTFFTLVAVIILWRQLRGFVGFFTSLLRDWVVDTFSVINVIVIFNFINIFFMIFIAIVDIIIFIIIEVLVLRLYTAYVSFIELNCCRRTRWRINVKRTSQTK